MRHEISLSAEEDMAEILDYVAESSVEAALGLLRAFDEVVKLICDQPGIGSPRPEIGTSAREWNPSGKLRSYRIFYYVDGEFVVVYQILHGARDQDVALRPPEA